MIQKNDSSVRNAESAHNHNTPSFEEVYAMPYVRESIECLLYQTIRQYKMLAGYKDDLRQEILIHLNGELTKFNPEKSSIQTFARIAILSGLRMARRRYYTRNSITLLNSIDFMAFEDHDDDSANLRDEDCRAYASYAKNNVDAAMLRIDIPQIIADCPQPYKRIAELMYAGYGSRKIAIITGVPESTVRYHHIKTLRKIFAKKLSKET